MHYRYSHQNTLRTRATPKDELTRLMAAVTGTSTGIKKVKSTNKFTYNEQISNEMKRKPPLSRGNPIILTVVFHAERFECINVWIRVSWCATDCNLPTDICICIFLQCGSRRRRENYGVNNFGNECSILLFFPPFFLRFFFLRRLLLQDPWWKWMEFFTPTY